MKQEYIQCSSHYEFDVQMGAALSKPHGKVISTGTCLMNAEYHYQGGSQCSRISYVHMYWAVVEYD